MERYWLKVMPATITRRRSAATPPLRRRWPVAIRWARHTSPRRGAHSSCATVMARRRTSRRRTRPDRPLAPIDTRPMARSSLPVQQRLLRSSYADDEAFTIIIRADKAIRIEQSRTVCSNGSLQRMAGVCGRGAGALFRRVVRGGRVGERQLADEGVAGIRAIGQRRLACFLSHHTTCAAPLSPREHDAGADLATVQKMVGHESVTTIAGYDRRGDAARGKAADLMCRFSRGRPE
jgi:hypothetical protein